MSAYGRGADRESRLVEVSEVPVTRERPANRARAINFGDGDDVSFRGSNNNKLRDGPVTLDDKDSFLFPDKFEQLKENGIAVDSYGRPVTPFPLSEEDVLSRAGSFKDSNGFVIPSYASGISEFVDPNLPIIPKQPLQQVQTPVRSEDLRSSAGPTPQASTTSIKVDQSQLPSDSLLPPHNAPSTFNQPPPISNEIILPLNGLLPPFGGENSPSTGREQPVAIVIIKPPPPKTVTTTTTTQRPQVVLPQLEQSLTPPNVQAPSREPFAASPVVAPSSQPVASRTSSSIVASSPTFTQQRLENVATVTTVKKYTGGFGGGPGLLGNGQVGFAISSDGRVDPNKVSVRQTAAAPAPTSSTTGFTFVGATPQQLPVAQNRFDASVNRYTAGFGGPPGFLVPFDHISSE